MWCIHLCFGIFSHNQSKQKDALEINNIHFIIWQNNKKETRAWLKYLRHIPQDFASSPHRKGLFSTQLKIHCLSCQSMITLQNCYQSQNCYHGLKQILFALIWLIYSTHAGVHIICNFKRQLCAGIHTTHFWCLSK